MNRSNASASMDTKHVVLDVVVQMIAIAITVLFFSDRIVAEQRQSVFALFVVFLIVFILSNRVANVYNVTLFYYLDRILRKEAWSFIVASLVSALVYFCCLNQSISQVFVIAFLSISFVLMVLEILVFRNLIDRIVSRKYVPRCIYVGSKDSYNKFRYFMKKTTMLVNEIGYVSYDDYDEGLEYIGSISQLESIIRRYNIDQVYIMQKRERDIADIQQYVDLCIKMGVTCRVIVDIYRRRKSYSYNSSIGTYPVITYHTICMNSWEAIAKRVFDIVFSIIAIILTSPIMLITAIAIKIDSPGPAIFKQVRVGMNGRHFKIWKFRSMRINADEMKKELLEQNEVKDGMMFKMKDDPRITRVGKIIRKLSIDELPQFFNVLSGSMSFVGTRPPTLDEVEKYQTDQWRRISIKPGITGMWQVSGRSNIKDFDEVVRLDVEYIDNWNLWLDIKLLFKTVGVVFLHEDSY
ncbi:MAG: sugar transferase [Agathobacter sp.]|nr:sugar transferase [Agathobacter sp.]